MGRKTWSLGFLGGGGYDESNFGDGVEENCELYGFVSWGMSPKFQQGKGGGGIF